MTKKTPGIYALRYLKLAESDLNEIQHFNKRFSKNYQMDILAKLQVRCESLMSQPYIYPEYEYNPLYRKMVVGDYHVFYRVSEKPNASQSIVYCTVAVMP